jgi:hypothetical protein
MCKTRQLELFVFEEIVYKGNQGKTCNKCNEFLPLSAFSNHSGSNYLRPECKKCNNKLSKRRNKLRAENQPPDKDYKCPICLRTEVEVSGKGNSKNGPWVVDHCHTTGEFRGWLCHPCNRGIGCFDDDTEMLNRVIRYLKK